MTASILVVCSVVLYVLSALRALSVVRIRRARLEVVLFVGALSLMAAERVIHLLPLEEGATSGIGFAALEFMAALVLFSAVLYMPVVLRSMLGAGAPEERVRFLLEESADEVFVLDAQGTRVVAANRHLAHRLSRSLAQMVGLAPTAIGPELTSAWLSETLAPLRSGRTPWVRVDTRFRAADGSTWPVGLHIQWGTYGSTEVLVVVAVNLAERRAAEEALRLSRTRMEDAQRIAHLATWAWDLQADTIIWSDELFRIFGREPGSFEPTFGAIIESMHPDDRSRMRGVVAEARESGTGFETEYRVLRPDGVVRSVHVRARMEHDDEGGAARLLGISQDITDLREAEEEATRSSLRYRRLFEQAPVSLWEEDLSEVLLLLANLREQGVTDLEAYLDAHPAVMDGAAALVTVLDVNPATVKLYGAESKEPFLGPLRLDGTEKRALRETLVALYEGRPHLRIDTREVAPDGTSRDLVVEMNLPVSAQDNGLALVSVVDVSERVAAVEALRAREAELSSALDAASMGIWHWDIPTGEVVWTKEAYDIYGPAASSFDGTIESVLSLIHPDDVESIQADFESAIAGSGDYLADFRLRPEPDGGVRSMAGAGRVEFDENGEPRSLHGLVWDVTAQRTAERALRESEARLASVMSHAPVVLFALDAQGRFTLSEGRNLQALGLEPGQLVGQSVFDVYAGLPSVLSAVRRVLLGEDVVTTVSVDDVVFDTHFSPMRDPSGDVTGVIGVATDITGVVRAEAEQAKLVSLVEGTRDFIALVTPDGVPTYINPAGLELVGVKGLDEARALLIRDFLARPSQFGDEVLPALESGGSWRNPLDVCALDSGERIPCYANCFMISDPVSGAPVAIALLLRDLREEREAERERDRMERQLRQAQKMETIGTLAGGIAHDFNNLLTPILGYAHLIQEESQAGGPFHEDLEEIVQAASRAKDLVRQILSFSRRQEQDFHAMDVAPVLREAARLLRSTLPSSIEIRVKIVEGCGWVRGDPTQLHQVILNLATNSLHAMKDQHGVLGIELSEVEVDQLFTSAHPTLIPGPHVRLTMSDTGRGIPPEVLDRVLEPFFTTKESTEGTGLGLSVVHGIVTTHKGALTLYSEKGVGTTVNLYLPVADHLGGAASASIEEVPRRDRLRVLVVDDRPDIASLVKRMLASLGHDAETAFGSVDALARIEAQPDHFDIMITDFSMPDMSGIELIGRAHEIRPGLPTVLASGFSETLTPEHLEREGVGAFLMKPFVVRELARAVDRAMEQEAEKDRGPAG